MRINPGDRIGALDAVETRSRIRQLPISESINRGGRGRAM